MRNIIKLLVMLPFIFCFWTAHAQERTITGTIQFGEK
jgi:hypothetical protein